MTFEDEKNYEPEQEFYDSRFSEFDIEWLREEGIHWREANEYPKCFDGYDIICLYGDKINPDIADLYHKNFNGEDICYMREAEVPIEFSNLLAEIEIEGYKIAKLFEVLKENNLIKL